MGTSTVEPLIWEFTPETFTHFPEITQFTLPTWATEQLMQWQYPDGFDDEKHYQVRHKGLEHMLGWLAPEIGYLDYVNSEEPKKHFKNLALFFNPSTQEPEETPKRVAQAFTFWMSVTLPEMPIDERQKIADTALDQENWCTKKIDYTLLKNYACPVPRDNMVYNALALLVADHLANTQIKGFTSGGILVSSGYKGGLYHGKTLLVYPPNKSTDPDRPGYWCECITISAMTNPESPKLRVSATGSIRNFGPINRASRFTDPYRSIDFFYPVRETSNKLCPIHHGEFQFSVSESDDENLESQWKTYDEHQVFDIIKRMSGYSIHHDIATQPIEDENGLWALPRLGKRHRDKSLPGGTGVPWVDRKAIAEHLDSELRPFGIHRVEAAHRKNVTIKGEESAFISGTTQPKRRKNESETEYHNRLTKHEVKVQTIFAARRQLVLLKLKNVQPSTNTLTIVCFHLRDDTPDRLATQIKGFLGEPDSGDNIVWHYAEGLQIQILSGKAGILSEPLSKKPLLDSINKPLTKEQKRKIIREEQRMRLKQLEKTMEAHIKSTLGNAALESGWIGLVEILEDLNSKPSQDPYPRVYRMIAQCGGLPQALLVSLSSKSSDHTHKENSQDTQVSEGDHVLLNAFLDGLRSFGVVPLESVNFTKKRQKYSDVQLVALYKIQRNKDKKKRGQLARPTIITPVVVLFGKGHLKVALMNRNGEIEWVEYEEAVRRFTLVDCYNFSGKKISRQEICRQQEGFFAEVLGSLEQKETIIYTDADNLRSVLPTLANGSMILGEFKLAHPSASAFDYSLSQNNLPISVVRISIEHGKRPSYIFPNERQEMITGIFQEPNREMTFWEIREKPVTMKSSKKALLVSRHPTLEVDSDAVDLPDEDEVDLLDNTVSSVEENTPERHNQDTMIAQERVAPILEEVTILHHSNAFSPLELARITRYLRGIHITYRDQTHLPFPLHEASKLADAIK